MYGDWQLGHTSLENYTRRHAEFVRAMREVDPDIKVVAVGATGRWSERMLAECASSMDMLSEHFYCGEKKDLEAHVAQVPESVAAKARAHRLYHETVASLAGRDEMIPIALDEWNYWYGEHVYGELGTRYYLKDALGVARGIHEMVRNCDVFGMANYAQTVNVLGCVKTSKTSACLAATGLPLVLYRRHFGKNALVVEGRPVPLDVACSLDDEGRLTVAVVNPTEEERTLDLEVRGGKPAGACDRYVISGPGPMAFNEPGVPPRVTLEEERASAFDPRAVEAPPASVVLYSVPVERDRGQVERPAEMRRPPLRGPGPRAGEFPPSGTPRGRAPQTPRTAGRSAHSRDVTGGDILTARAGAL
jgi:alpha-N-arabinofuranosidase